MEQVVAEARRLKILTATLETNGATGIKRAVGSVEFDAISAKFSVSEPNRDVAFGY